MSTRNVRSFRAGPIILISFTSSGVKFLAFFTRAFLSTALEKSTDFAFSSSSLRASFSTMS